MTLGKPALTLLSVSDNSDFMDDLGRTIETLTVGDLWSIGVTATLFTIFMCYAYYSLVREHRHELSWLGWTAICTSAFFALGIPLIYGVQILLDLWLLTD